MQQLTPSLKTSPFTLTSPPIGFSGTTFCQVSPDKKIIDIFNDESGNVMWLAKISGDYWTVCVSGEQTVVPIVLWFRNTEIGALM